MIGLRVLLWQSDGLEEKALLPQYLVHGNNGPTGQTDFFVDSLLATRECDAWSLGRGRCFLYRWSLRLSACHNDLGWRE